MDTVQRIEVTLILDPDTYDRIRERLDVIVTEFDIDCRVERMDAAAPAGRESLARQRHAGQSRE